MSRTPIFLILAVLLVLLGVMGFVVNPKPKGPPTAEEVAKQQEMAKQAQEQEMKDRQKQMKMMLDMKKKMGKQQGGSSKTAPTPVPVMDITNDWFHKHSDGAKGLAEADELTKAQIKADRAAENAEKQMMMGAMGKNGGLSLDLPKKPGVPAPQPETP